jgi:hypothetical protein
MYSSFQQQRPPVHGDRKDRGAARVRADPVGGVVHVGGRRRRDSDHALILAGRWVKHQRVFLTGR